MRCTVIAAALALAGTLVGCGRDDEPRADPSPTTSATASTSASASSTPEPTWDDEFSPRQLERYSAARDRWLEFWKAYTQAARTGADTPGLKAMFEKYSMTPLGDRSEFLDTYVRGGARMELPPEVLWTSASTIGRRAVTFNYCLDYSSARITTNGQVNHIGAPSRRLIEVQMEKTSKGWMKKGYVNSGVKACRATAP